MLENMNIGKISIDPFGEAFSDSFKSDSDFGKNFEEAFKSDANFGKDFSDYIRSDFKSDRTGPQWKENDELKPNTEYKTGEYDYKYKTDEQGRIISVETDDLKRTKREERLPHNSDSPDKQKGDDAGHLLGDRFGGSPDVDNIVSQDAEVNRGEYKKMEDEWADAIDNGEKVQVDIDVKYEGDDKRPSEIDVSYKIGDGDWEERRFDNQKEGA